MYSDKRATEKMRTELNTLTVNCSHSAEMFAKAYNSLGKLGDDTPTEFDLFNTAIKFLKVVV